MLELRLEHPDASLSELARLGGLTKSATNHRLRRLLALSSQQRAPKGLLKAGQLGKIRM